MCPPAYSERMHDASAPFKGKRITVLGLGLLGRAVGDAAFLAECGAEVLVTDLKSEAELAPSVEQLKTYSNIRFRLGEHREEDVVNADLVIKAAGVPLDSPYVAAAKRAGVHVAMSTALFAKYAREQGTRIVGVTGTRGKTTVAHMIFHALPQERTFLGGNVRGVSTLAMLPKVAQGDIAVLELDSWQLQGFGEERLSPHIAVFTNFMPDHQNYYPDMDAYFADKANIFAFQSESDVLIVDQSVADRISSASPAGKMIVPESLPPSCTLAVPGAHNRENAALAFAALRQLGVGSEEALEALEAFPGVEGRLQFVREIRGVKIFNDNNATTPEATVAALRALDRGEKNIILIMGGADKGLDMSALWKEIMEKCKDVYFLSGSGVDRIRPEAPHVPEFGSIREALSAALESAESGDVVLFSPAFASFGLFKNEYERNDAFLEAVRATADS